MLHHRLLSMIVSFCLAGPPRTASRPGVIHGTGSTHGKQPPAPFFIYAQKPPFANSCRPLIPASWLPGPRGPFPRAGSLGGKNSQKEAYCAQMKDCGDGGLRLLAVAPPLPWLPPGLLSVSRPRFALPPPPAGVWVRLPPAVGARPPGSRRPLCARVRTPRTVRRLPPSFVRRPFLVVAVLVGWVVAPSGGAGLGGGVPCACPAPVCRFACPLLLLGCGGLPMRPGRCPRPRVGRRCGGGGSSLRLGVRAVKHAPCPGRLAAGRGLPDPRHKIRGTISGALVPEIGPPGD